MNAPIWDRGEGCDAEALRYATGDDPLWDRRLVAHDIRGSLSHAAGLLQAGLLTAEQHAQIVRGLESLLEDFRAGLWTVEAGDEDVHSTVERRLIERIGEHGKRLHTARSRNEQIALDLRLWLREAAAQLRGAVLETVAIGARLAQRAGALPLPGYTHLRRAMPSTVGDWMGAHVAAWKQDLEDLQSALARARLCPLGSGAGYGVPVELPRAAVAAALGFDAPEEPVTAVQHGRGRAELAYLTALEGIALDLGKLAADLWLFSSEEFGFVRLPAAWTTGSSLMPHKRNPDVLELLRAHCRQVVAERAALLDVLRDLPSGYHRDFQLIKPPLFRAHDTLLASLRLVARLLDALEFDAARLDEAAADPKLQSVARTLERVRAGEAFRDAYRTESRR
ncbi:MAG: argininosuccinate lyase [Planctomycetota bacterium]|nr:MAG: argininosuccinate lyase [Planctomycetota bacterium]